MEKPVRDALCSIHHCSNHAFPAPLLQHSCGQDAVEGQDADEEQDDDEGQDADEGRDADGEQDADEIQNSRLGPLWCRPPATR